MSHTVANTFGSPEAFKGRLIVDAGGGSGAQTKWFAEYGAKHVILMELSHSVDDVVKSNVMDLANVDVIQCSIDAPPIRDRSIDGIVYCHNVIQHTPSVEKTAHALYSLVAPGGEFVFNCYGVNDGPGILRWIRYHLIGRGLFAITRRMNDRQVMVFSYTMAWLRMIPFVGWFLERCGIIRCGDVPAVAGESTLSRLKRRFKQTYLNTRDQHGQHHFQHGKTNSELQRLLGELQPDPKKILNADRYFAATSAHWHRVPGLAIGTDRHAKAPLSTGGARRQHVAHPGSHCNSIFPSPELEQHQTEQALAVAATTILSQ